MKEKGEQEVSSNLKCRRMRHWWLI